MCLTETHLTGDNVLNVTGYTWYGHNRTLRHVNAVKGSGGVGILVKNKLFDTFNITYINKSVDGILTLQLTDKYTDFSFLIINCYLPPENSPHSRNITDFFAHILTELYLFAEVDFIIVCGDFNSRIGNLKDVIDDIDGLPPRQVLDSQKNGFADSFTEFLQDAKLCILNGRLNPDLNNYTSISGRGKAVVDYMLTPHDCFQSCDSFSVQTISDLIEKYNLHGLICERCKPPDHSILSVYFSPLLDTSTIHDMESRTQSENVNNNTHERYNCRRYRFDVVPEMYMASDTWKTAINNMIDMFISLQGHQAEIDMAYNEFCKLLTTEMDCYLKYSDASKSTRKKYKNKKPYWNDHLSTLWREMNIKEKEFLKCKGSKQSRTLKRAQFIKARQTFDKNLRQAERQFNKQVILEIDEVCTNNPHEFWNYIKQLGPRKRNSNIPFQVYNTDGNFDSNIQIVLNKWKSDFEQLFNRPAEADDSFSHDFYLKAKQMKLQREQEMTSDEYIMNSELNENISYDEVEKVIGGLKNKKSFGFDGIPNEALKQPDVVKLLYNLFNKCFHLHIMPSIWLKAIITPIPKSSTKDPHIPMHYRGISLLSCICKAYSCIINNRIVKYFELLELFADEQNGFRKQRSCLDHIFSLSSIIRNRSSQNLSTFCCFIDMKKAFDWIDLLFYKLLLYNIDGHLYHSIKSLYSHPVSSIKLNNYLTEWFYTESGVRQGDSLSPTLFGIYINDLAAELKSLNIGISINDVNVCTLMYADDIVLIAENENDLQSLLNCVYDWCYKWRLMVNIDKTNVVHFRKVRTLRTNFEFKYGEKNLDIINQYKYLGIILDEHLTFNATAAALAGGAGRALGSVITKFSHLKNIGYETYTKMFETSVVPILDYSSGVWGFKLFPDCDKIQNRAIRYYLGVHPKAPLLAITGDMGWMNSQVRRHINMIRLWNRLIKMEDSRLTKKVFLWDHALCKNNWSEEILKIFTKIEFVDIFYNKDVLDIDFIQEKLSEKMQYGLLVYLTNPNYVHM